MHLYAAFGSRAPPLLQQMGENKMNSWLFRHTPLTNSNKAIMALLWDLVFF